MKLPSKGDVIKWSLWGIVTIGLFAMTYKAYQLHYNNVMWCVSHQIECQISMLENQKVVLESASK